MIMLLRYRPRLSVFNRIKNNVWNQQTIKFCNNLLLRKHYSSVTAGLLIIGDEILKGTTDVNTPFLIKELNGLHVKIVKVAIVPDSIDAISKEVRELSYNCTYVLTSGGIGPTHDDVTYEAVAKACNDELQLNEELYQQFLRYFGPESKNNPGIVKYASIPKSAILNYLDVKHNNKFIKFPIVSVRNIYIFPGVPILLQKSFAHFKNKLTVPIHDNYSKEIYLDLDEFSIVTILNEAVDKFKDYVKFGSYPTFTDNYYKLKIALESSNPDKIEDAVKFLQEKLPKHHVTIKKDVLKLAKEDVYLLGKTSPNVSLALSVIEQAVTKYPSTDLCLCFNGGKDCTALLHLIYSCIQRHKPEEWNKIQILYVKCGETFREVEDFIEQTAIRYNFHLTTLHGDLKHSISAYVKSHPNIKAMMLGTRKSDPGGSNLNHFCPTDSGWASIERILPLLNWTYTDVWCFLRQLQVPYCILYDRGYTSLGEKSKTVQNPSLLNDDRKSFQSYKPAYMLQNEDCERQSRL